MSIKNFAYSIDKTEATIKIIRSWETDNTMIKTKNRQKKIFIRLGCHFFTAKKKRKLRLPNVLYVFVKQILYKRINFN